MKDQMIGMIIWTVNHKELEKGNRLSAHFHLYLCQMQSGGYGIFYMKNINDLEHMYKSFREKHTDIKNSTFVEYLGINFSEDRLSNPVFKVYYTTTKSIENIPFFLKPFVERNMIHALNKVDDTINNDNLRYEIGLKHRTNANMSFVDEWIRRYFPSIEFHRNDIEQFHRIKCSYNNDYQSAAMYFLGLIADIHNSNTPKVKAIKLHYILRWCHDPDKIGKRYTVDNEKYLNLLSDLEISEIKQLSEYMSMLMQNDNGELWMAAVDYYIDEYTKYKIYIKKFSKNIYDLMLERFKKMKCLNLVNQISIYYDWVSLHPELERYGIAVCLDNHGIWSVNFYH